MEKVIGISGSPIKNSNTDRALQIALEATGLRTEFYKLSEIEMHPCDACLGCIETNECVHKDDAHRLVNKVWKADGFIIAGFTPYSSLDSRTKCFIERLYPLRHRHGLMKGKPGAGIICSAIPQGHGDLPNASENGMDAIKNYMMADGLDFVGGVIIQGNVPCIKCGENGQCQESSLKMINGHDKIEVNDFEQDEAAVQALKDLGEALTKKICPWLS